MKKYEKVEKALMENIEPKTVEDLSVITGLSKNIVAASMATVRKSLAIKGLVLVNKRGHGYFVGSASTDLRIEVDKAIKRAKAHLGSLRNICSLLASFSNSNELMNESNELFDNLYKQLDSLKDLGIEENFKEVGVPDHIKRLLE